MSPTDNGRRRGFVWAGWQRGARACSWDEKGREAAAGYGTAVKPRRTSTQRSWCCESADGEDAEGAPALDSAGLGTPSRGALGGLFHCRCGGVSELLPALPSRSHGYPNQLLSARRLPTMPQGEPAEMPHRVSSAANGRSHHATEPQPRLQSLPPRCILVLLPIVALF